MLLELDSVLPAPRTRFWLVLPLVSFASNWVWEMAQMRMYATLADQPWLATVPPCTAAAAADAGLALMICGAAMLLGRLLRLPVLLSSAFLGALAAVSIERLELARGSWSYSEAMPVVPVVGIGLWPLLQLTLLVPVAIGLARWWTSRRTSQTR